MEGVAASRWTVKVDTINTRVEIATTSYGRGGNAIPNVALFTTSNVVIGAGNAIVEYATGSIMLNGQQVSTGTSTNLLPSTNSWTGGNTFGGASTFSATGSVALLGPVTGPQIIEVWAYVQSNASVSDSVGVTSVTAVATGIYRVNFAAPFSNSLYGVGVAADSVSRNCTVSGTLAAPRATTAVAIECTDLENGSANVAFSVQITGRRP